MVGRGPRLARDRALGLARDRALGLGPLAVQGEAAGAPGCAGWRLERMDRMGCHPPEQGALGFVQLQGRVGGMGRLQP